MAPVHLSLKFAFMGIKSIICGEWQNSKPRATRLFKIAADIRAKIRVADGGRYHWPRPHGIRRRLIFWGLGLLATALVLNTVASSIYTRKEIQRASAQLQMEIALATARQIHLFIARKIERLQDATVSMSLYSLGGNDQRLLSHLLLRADSSINEVSILDKEGMERIRLSDRRLYLPSDLRNEFDSPAFTEGIAGKVHVGPVRTTTRGEPYLTMAVPIKTTPSKTIGVLVAKVDLKFLWERLGEAKFGAGGYAYIVNEAGLLIAHPDPARVLEVLSLEKLPKVQQFLSAHEPDNRPAEKTQGIGGTAVLSTYARVEKLGWAVIVEEPLNLALDSVRLLEQFAGSVLLVGLLLSAAVMICLSRKISSPIQELRRSVATIGSGNLDHRAVITTGDEIEELANEFNKMTDNLQNLYATLEQNVEQRTKEISALYKVTTTVSQSLSLQEISEAVITKISEIFAFESMRIYLFNDETDELEPRASIDAGSIDTTRVRTFKRGKGIIGRVAESGKPMIFEDIRTDPNYAALSLTKMKQIAKLNFFAVFPIATKSRIFGVLHCSARAPRSLTAAETQLLKSMCEQLAVALEKASLYRQSEKRSEELSVLHAIGGAVSQSLDIELLLGAAVEKLVTRMRFDAAWVYVRDPDDESELKIKAHKGLEDNVVRSLDHRKLSPGISGNIFENGQRLVFEDIQNDQEYERLSARKVANSLGFASGAAFPIKAQHGVIGVLYLASKTRRRFTHDELQLIESIVHEIGVAMENARLFEEVKKKTEEQRQTNQDLQEANRAKSEFIAAMSHELRTPLNVIMGNAELTSDGFFGIINAEQKKSMTQIRHHSQFLLKLVNDVLALARLDAKKMSVEPVAVDIDEVISHAQAQIAQLNRNNRLQVTWNVEPNLPPIVTDLTKLQEILQNLIGNAFKFTPRGRIQLRIRNIRERERIEFSVADTGIGIEPGDMDKIFSAFEQLKEAHTEEYNGVGLGLNIVKKYLELMHGDIRVESVPEEGSNFIFSIPYECPPSTEIKEPVRL